MSTNKYCIPSKNDFFKEEEPHESRLFEKQIEEIQKYYAEKEIDWNEFMKNRLSVDMYKKLKR